MLWMKKSYYCSEKKKEEEESFRYSGAIWLNVTFQGWDNSAIHSAACWAPDSRRSAHYGILCKCGCAQESDELFMIFWFN